jgi:flagellar basal body-associated protein FliL
MTASLRTKCFCSPSQCGHLLACLGLLLAFSFSTSTLCAQEAEQADSAKDAAENDEQVRPTIDLGKFEIRELRPTSNATIDIVFALHLSLPSSTDAKVVEQLKKWQHRLRNQAIIAMRKTETNEFFEPDLALFRRKILLRVNRLLKDVTVEEVFITQFTIKSH